MSCRIELENPSNSFLAGGEVIGKVISVFNSPEETQGTILTIKGIESVHWYSNKTTYSGKNKFLFERKILASAERLGPGSCEYPFQFTLPLNIPTSYTYKYGTVVYTLKAKVLKAYRSNYENKIVLNVTKPLDLNEIEDKSFLDPSIFDAEKTVCCGCLSGGAIAMEVQMEKRAFIPEETVKIWVRVSNDSNQNVKYVKTEFKLCVKAEVEERCKSGSILHETTLAKARDEGFGAQSEKHYEILLQLPEVETVPNFVDTKYLSCYYQLYVIAGLPWYHPNLVASVPVLLANIPIRRQDYLPDRLQDMEEFNPLTLIGESDIQFIDEDSGKILNDFIDVPELSGALALLSESKRRNSRKQARK